MLAHLDFGKTVLGDDVNGELGRRMGVSLRLLLIATILGGTTMVACSADYSQLGSGERPSLPEFWSSVPRAGSCARTRARAST